MFQIIKSEANKYIDDGQRTKANAKIYYWQQQPVKTKLGQKNIDTRCPKIILPGVQPYIETP